MKRAILSSLKSWTYENNRKVLLLRGARQIGKTYCVRQLAEEFDSYLEVNFEEEPAIHSFFEDSLNPQGICQKLSAYFQKPIIPGKTLLFLDEIQACPQAIMALRFFYEKMPELHVISAGSLLEFALEDIASFGVGRIRSLYMYPMSFEEFLWATHPELTKILNEHQAPQALAIPFHQKLIEHYKAFQLIGGMPEVVQTYVNQKDFLACQAVLDDVLSTLQDDFAKYKKRSPVILLNEVLQSIVAQAGSKFKFAHVGETYYAKQVKEALQLLCKANLAIQVFHSSAQGLPLGAQKNPKKFKVLFFDTGLQQRLLGLNMGPFLASQDFQVINKGNIAENFVGLELLKYASPVDIPKLFYWHRESKSSNAELDYIIQQNEHIIPIEVKANLKGSMQSMHLFLKERNISRGTRVSLENFGTYQNIDVFPLYAIKQMLNVHAG